MRYLKLFLLTSVFILSGCSIQVAGFSGSYEKPTNIAESQVAKLSVASKDLRIISIDKKSITANTVALYPGNHKITLYVGANNYASKINHMVVITADFEANKVYFLRLKSGKVLIENANGTIISSIVSDMHVKKSISI